MVGFAEISIRSDHVEGTTESPVPYIEGWYVDPKSRSIGIGKALIKAAEDYALKMGFNELASDAELSNDLSIGIHKRIGFKEVGRTVHFVKTIKKCKLVVPNKSIHQMAESRRFFHLSYS